MQSSRYAKTIMNRPTLHHADTIFAVTTPPLLRPMAATVTAWVGRRVGLLSATALLASLAALGLG